METAEPLKILPHSGLRSCGANAICTTNRDVHAKHVENKSDTAIQW